MWKAIWLGIYFAVLIWSGIEPKGYFIWILEVGPALIGSWRRRGEKHFALFENICTLNIRH